MSDFVNLLFCMCFVVSYTQPKLLHILYNLVVCYTAIYLRTQLLSTDYIRAKLGLISRCRQNTRLQSTHNLLPGSTFKVQGPHYHPKLMHQQGLVHSRPQLPKRTISFKNWLNPSRQLWIWMTALLKRRQLRTAWLFSDYARCTLHTCQKHSPV